MSSESGGENKERRVIKIGSQRKGHENVGRPEEKVVVQVPPKPQLPGSTPPEKEEETAAATSTESSPPAPVETSAVIPQAPLEVPEPAAEKAPETRPSPEGCLGV